MEQVIKKQIKKLTLNDNVVTEVIPTSVQVQPSLDEGIEVAKIYVNGEKSTVYIPKTGIADVVVDNNTIKKSEVDGSIYVNKITKSKVSDFGNYLTADTFIPTKTSELMNDRGFALSSDINIPTKTSQLENDSGFLTEHQSLEEYAKKAEVSANISCLSNSISSKIFIKDFATSSEKNVNTLSIVQYNTDEIYRDIANGVQLCSDVLYIVNTGYLNACGCQLCNLTMNNYEDPIASYEGIATTDKYVNSLCANICTKVNNLSTALTTLNTVKVDKIGEETINLDDFTVEGYLKYLTTKMGGTAN